MFVINPDSFLLPLYRISPFTTSAIGRNNSIKEEFSNVAKDYFNNRFGIGNWLLTSNGREAISLALKTMDINSSMNISIVTPSQNSYISSCVTSTIELFCTWDINKIGDIILVNHEFGYLKDDIVELSNLGLPLIEDCCTTFFSQDEKQMIGLYGNYSVYSFPKFFSIQIGGLLVGKNIIYDKKIVGDVQITADEQEYILRVVGFELSQQSEILSRRKAIFDYSTSKFMELGFTLRFPNKLGTVPSVLLLNNNSIIKDLSHHKEYLHKLGIQNSVFYGEDAFYIPCHQNITETDVDYFRFVTENFILEQ